MWVLRELARLLARIAVGVLIAIVIAEIRAVAGGGDTPRTFRIILLVLGGLYLLLAAGGTGSAASRMVNWGEATAGRGGMIFRGFRPRPDEPRLSAGAVFVGSAIALFALGVVL
ncbi:MAG TPA: hypothetical protein VFA82_07875 [Gaiellaceae bacterium]|nr:hypothetical protein [Gaiellaceae bacterium]